MQESTTDYRPIEEFRDEFTMWQPVKDRHDNNVGIIFLINTLVFILVVIAVFTGWFLRRYHEVLLELRQDEWNRLVSDLRKAGTEETCKGEECSLKPKLSTSTTSTTATPSTRSLSTTTLCNSECECSVSTSHETLEIPPQTTSREQIAYHRRQGRSLARCNSSTSTLHKLDTDLTELKRLRQLKNIVHNLKSTVVKVGYVLEEKNRRGILNAEKKIFAQNALTNLKLDLLSPPMDRCFNLSEDIKGIYQKEKQFASLFSPPVVENDLCQKERQFTSLFSPPSVANDLYDRNLKNSSLFENFRSSNGHFREQNTVPVKYNNAFEVKKSPPTTILRKGDYDKERVKSTKFVHFG